MMLITNKSITANLIGLLFLAHKKMENIAHQRENSVNMEPI